jgi:RNA polymerase sigma factor (sigma-70 family)
MPEPGLHPTVVRFIRRPVADEPDAALLARFLDGRDGDAFRALVGRHGSMVLDVCRCVLGNEADAEDAFQATFLVLARNAAAVRKAASLASWLHGVACRTARKARAGIARRREVEGRPREPTPPAADELSWREVRAILHEELLGLPELYRGPLALCYLQGFSHDRAAAALGVSKAAVKKRLERGRERLRARLTRRGLGPAAVLAAGAVPTAAAAVPPALEALAVRAAVAADPGAVPAHVLSLAEGGLTPVFTTKLAASLGLLPAVALGLALLGGPGEPAGRAQERPPAPARSAAAETPVDPAAREAKWLTGVWKVTRVEANGEPLLTPAGLKNARVTFEANTAEVVGFQLLFVGTFSFRLDPGKTPKEIDVTPQDGPMRGRTFAGIYVVRQAEMRVCLRLEQTEKGRPKGYVTSGGSGLYTLILEPERPKGPPPAVRSDAPRKGPTPAAAPAGGAGDDPRADTLSPELRKVWDAIPLPKKTPFDADAKKRQDYLRSYRNGYFWAQGHHLLCPTNPQPDNLHAIRGWVEGWQAGVKAGGQGDLPAKYAPYLVWGEAADRAGPGRPPR